MLDKRIFDCYIDSNEIVELLKILNRYLKEYTDKFPKYLRPQYSRKQYKQGAKFCRIILMKFAPNKQIPALKTTKKPPEFLQAVSFIMILFCLT